MSFWGTINSYYYAYIHANALICRNIDSSYLPVGFHVETDMAYTLWLMYSPVLLFLLSKDVHVNILQQIHCSFLVHKSISVLLVGLWSTKPVANTAKTSDSTLHKPFFFYENNNKRAVTK